ncbi:hypothetical protein EJD97_000486 [Solanum chilense]|uniref:Uncharacterized protein n=1 Tax=Solanum chilense TaxID=4083 RepID=A0A6N2AVY4_SOLCI|nr:hypothetical protein EJD97_000486 [Solanum chilense]
MGLENNQAGAATKRPAISNISNSYNCIRKYRGSRCNGDDISICAGFGLKGRCKCSYIGLSWCFC